MNAGTRDEVRANVATIRERLTAACGRAGRDAAEVRIVAAAKTVPVSAIRWVVEAGLPDIGHNYVQELRESRPAVPGARWHFIGTLQTGSAHLVAANADVVQTLASPRSAERLARRAADAGRRLEALIEVDLTGERSGVSPEEVPAFARRVAGLEGVELTGLMTLPPIPTDPEDGRPFFVRLRELRDRLREDIPQVVELSMGMSLDYEVAAEEGATMVRIGTALFGPRAVSGTRERRAP
jgi:pyridoxal phosphate enzyme (YggS family)